MTNNPYAHILSSSKNSHLFKVLTLIISISISGHSFAADKVQKVISTGVERNDQASLSQEKIDKISDQTDDIVGEYKTVSKIVEGLNVYNKLLQKQIDAQRAEIDQLNYSIGQVKVIERQITPLMLRMLDGLEQFIELDVPFLLEERRNRVQRLKDLMERADVTSAEKFRSVLEAFQIETAFGRDSEAYKGILDLDGKSREVNFLRIGRIALLYQSYDAKVNGVWDQTQRQWVKLKAEEYRNHTSKGLKIARKQIAPELLMLPVAAAGGAQ